MLFFDCFFFFCFMQCKTTCEFKKKAVAFSVDMNSPITAVLEGSATASQANADGPSNSDSVSEGAMIKAAANAVAKKQQRLQHIRSLIKSSPDDAALQTHETTLQLDISRMLHKMLGKGTLWHTKINACNIPEPIICMQRALR